jgi:hypothetical protein
MLDADEPVLWYVLNRLMVDYCDDVDCNGGEHAHEFCRTRSTPSATTGSTVRKNPCLLCLATAVPATPRCVTTSSAIGLPDDARNANSRRRS